MFIIYSFLGWVWESFFYSLWDKHRIVNRGFMVGPYIPIYGSGALIDILLLSGLKDKPVLLFFVSAVICCAVEYLTGYLMEKMFNARWWDYTDMLLHLNGRICIEGFFAFGLMSVALLRFINPYTIWLIGLMPPLALHLVSWGLIAIFVFDLVISVKHAADFEEKIGKIAEKLSAVKDRMAALYDTVVVETFFRGMLQFFTRQQKRMLDAFPSMRSVSYPGIIRGLQSAMPENVEERRRFLREDGPAVGKGEIEEPDLNSVDAKTAEKHDEDTAESSNDEGSKEQER